MTSLASAGARARVRESGVMRPATRESLMPRAVGRRGVVSPSDPDRIADQPRPSTTFRASSPSAFAPHRTLWLLLCGALLLALSGPAAAHKASDAYLQLHQTPSGLTLRWDIALRDLDAAIDLDANADGRLSWGEVKAGWDAIERYVAPRLRIEGCPLTVQGAAQLERRSDGVYAVLQRSSACRPAGVLAIDYSLFRDVDPTHRGILKLQQEGQALTVAVLDPNRSAATTLRGPQDTAGGSAPVRSSGVQGSDGAARESGLRPDAGRSDGPGAGRPDASRSGADGGLGFTAEGIRHIVTGYDHVLFLLCLLLPSVTRRTPQGWTPVPRLSDAVWPVVGIVTAFTVAHSITLVLAATGRVSLPASVIEPAIAITIVLAAIDNLRRIFPVKRVVVAFCFGLIHGFGFAGVLAELELPATQFAWALLQFNLGLEAGQLAIVFVVTALLFVARRLPAYPNVVIRGGSCLAIVLGVVWLIERTADVSLLPF